VGVDIEIRPHNRAAIERHPLARRIVLIEGSSVAPEVVERVRARAAAGSKVLAVLDSRHTRDHVLAELRAYAPMVSVGSYVVVMDGIMGEVTGAPRTDEDWSWNNPRAAAAAFVADDPRFILAPPPFAFNEGAVDAPLTYAPGGFLRRVA
jgi:cephalosporin hydroxylase